MKRYLVLLFIFVSVHVFADPAPALNAQGQGQRDALQGKDAKVAPSKKQTHRKRKSPDNDVAGKSGTEADHLADPKTKKDTEAAKKIAESIRKTLGSGQKRGSSQVAGRESP